MELRKKILEEALKSQHSIHPKENKMYRDFKQKYWWNKIKRKTANYVATCLTCQKAKSKDQRTVILL